jgi:phosphatidylglycerol:prolipoprotein diacylglycerol transferase
MCPYSLSLHVGSLSINLYGVMLALGFLAALLSWRLLGRREGRDLAFCSDLLFWIMVSGVLGARAAYVAANFGAFRDNRWSMLYLHEGGLVFYGGFLGSLAAVLVFARWRRERILPLLDFIVTAVPLGHAFGRIGCFLRGCCFGRIWDGALAVRFPAWSDPWCVQVNHGRILRTAPLSQPVHPVQLYEAAFNVVLYLALMWAYRRRTRDGLIASAYLLTYPVARFWVEEFRGDERLRWLGVDVAQWVSLGLFLFGVVLLIRSWRQPPRAQGALPAATT